VPIYIIGGYWCQYILLMVIGGYFMLNYHTLLIVISGNILLMAIGGYWWLS
jgi:hypothetical protein